MAKHTVTRSCGHEEVVELFGKREDRDWRIENVEEHKLCGECYRKLLDDRNKKALKEAREMGLPELTGTKKQIGWAESIRLDTIERFNNIIREERVIENKKEMNTAIEVFDHILGTKGSARWWIDNRDISTSDTWLVGQLAEEHEGYKAATVEQSPDAVAAKAEATVYPEDSVTETVAEIRTSGETLEIFFPEKRDDFREIVKGNLKMRWDNGVWARRIDTWNGPMEARAAEAGHRLLANGFAVRIYSDEIRIRAVTGEYEPECTRWVRQRVEGEYTGWFSIGWMKWEENFYDVARRLRGSRYSRPDVVVPAEQYAEVLDFAEMYDFKLSNGAKELVDKAKLIREGALVAADVTITDNEPIDIHEKPVTLEVPEKVEIADEFKD